MFPERFSNLPAYAFPRLRALLDVHEPGGPVMHMTIGEPKHAKKVENASQIGSPLRDLSTSPPARATRNCFP